MTLVREALVLFNFCIPRLDCHGFKAIDQGAKEGQGGLAVVEKSAGGGGAWFALVERDGKRTRQEENSREEYVCRQAGERWAEK